MDRSERIRLIAELRDELGELSYDDAELVMEEFGFGFMPTNDWEFERARELGRLLRAATDDDLVSLGSHLSSETVEDAAHGVTRAASGSRRPLALFASHQSSHKALVGSVAAALDRYGVELFVAHEDIEPDREWKDEILKALGTTDGGVAFLHQEFKGSDWCGQEVGWLLGRGVPVVSLKFDLAPYGPLGERQAIPAAGKDAPALAEALLDVLEARPELHGGLASSLVKAMRESRSFKNTDEVWERLRKLRNLDEEQCRVLLGAVEDNTQVYWASSPHDSGRAYADVVRKFLRQQPGSPAGEAELDGYDAEQSA